MSGSHAPGPPTVQLSLLDDPEVGMPPTEANSTCGYLLTPWLWLSMGVRKSRAGIYGKPARSSVLFWAASGRKCGTPSVISGLPMPTRSCGCEWMHSGYIRTEPRGAVQPQYLPAHATLAGLLARRDRVIVGEAWRDVV